MDEYPGLPRELAEEWKAVKARHAAGRSDPEDIPFLLDMVERGMRATVGWMRAWEALAAERYESGAPLPRLARDPLDKRGPVQPSASPKRPRAPKPGERAFTDHLGTAWIVAERMVAASEGSRRSCLVFESSGSSRRVFTYPENWRELEPWALEKLSWGR